MIEPNKDPTMEKPGLRRAWHLALWDHLEFGWCRWLRGWEVSLGPLRVHTTNLVLRLMFVALGTVFITYEGTSTLSGVYEENGAVNTAYAAESWVSTSSRFVPDYLLVAVLAVVGLVLARVGAYFRKRERVPDRSSRNGEETST